MKFITRDTDYAVRALCFIAQRSPKVVDAGLLVSELKIPRAFLRKLLQSLTRNGFLVSLKGRGGGFALNRPPSQIRVMDVVESFQGPFSLTNCVTGGGICPERKRCRLRRKIGKIEKFAVRELNNTRLDELLA